MAGLQAEPTLSQMGISVVAVRVAALTPSLELARALQAPTFESLQQKADEATFSRRALAVDKERAIAENELSNRIELASRRAELIARDDANDRAEAEALRIRAVEQASADIEAARMAALTALDATQLFALAARDFATEVDRIDQLTVTPDMLAGLVKQLGLR